MNVKTWYFDTSLILWYYDGNLVNNPSPKDINTRWHNGLWQAKTAKCHQKIFLKSLNKAIINLTRPIVAILYPPKHQGASSKKMKQRLIFQRDVKYVKNH